MRSQHILGSPPFIILGFLLARLLPKPAGHWLSRQIARWMAWRRNQLFCTVRANLRHVVAPETTAAEIDRMAEQALYYMVRSNYDMLHTTKTDYRKGRAPVRLDPEEWRRTLEALQDGRGTVLVGPHMSNFDMAMQWIAAQGVKIQALSLAHPNLGTRTINRLRMHRGIEITPIDVHSLRKAVERLKRGGIVVTGADRQASSDDERFLFFGAPAPMPTGPVRLALQTNARIIAGCCLQEPDGVYRVYLAPPLEMERTGNKAQDIRHNEQRLLAIIEEMIRLDPEQWGVLVPVWPEESTSCDG